MIQYSISRERFARDPNPEVWNVQIFPVSYPHPTGAYTMYRAKINGKETRRDYWEVDDARNAVGNAFVKNKPIESILN